MCYYCINRGGIMNQYYNQNYTKDEICPILKTFKDCIRENHFIISKNKLRQENINFINQYNLNSKKLIKILLEIEADDFCHTLQNKNVGFEHETLYVFCPQAELFNSDDEKELIDIYIKINIIDLASSKRVVVISFHKRNKQIQYPFRNEEEDRYEKRNDIL